MAAKKEASKNSKRASLKEMKPDLNKEAAQDEKKETGFLHTVFGNVKKFKSSVNTSVVNRSKKAEKLHLAVASWPINALGNVNRLENYATDIHAIQSKTIGHGYDLVRTVVSKVDDITDEILVRAEKQCVMFANR